MDFFDVVRARRSVRAFLTKEVDAVALRRLLEAVTRAPSAGDLQAYEVVVVRHPERRRELARAAYGQTFVAQAPVVLVFCAHPRRSAGKYGRRGAELYCIQDATIAASHAQLAAVALGLATVWVGAFDDAAVADLVGGLDPVCIMPVGYPNEEPEPTPRRSVDELVHLERLPVNPGVGATARMGRGRPGSDLVRGDP